MHGFIKKYATYKSLFGDFWGVYFAGFRSIFDVKWEIISNILQLGFIAIEIRLASSAFKILNEEKRIPIAYIGVVVFIESIKATINSYFHKRVENEYRKIDIRLCEDILNEIRGSSFTWKGNHGMTEQKDAVESIALIVHWITSQLMTSVQQILSTACFFWTMPSDKTVFAFIFVCTNIILIGYNMFVDTKCTEQRVNAMIIQKKADISVWNQFAFFTDTMYSPILNKVLGKYNNPIDGMRAGHDAWDAYHATRQSSTVRMSWIKAIVTYMSMVYFWYYGRIDMILLMIQQKYRLFGYFDSITMINTMSSFATQHGKDVFPILGELIEECHDCELREVIVDNAPELNFIEEIKFTNIHKVICPAVKDEPAITLDFAGTVSVPIKKQFIQLNGVKGCAKSTTLKILAGEYDGILTDGVEINGVRTLEEFRAMRNCRIYLRQDILDAYQRNEKATITMTLEELFPMGEYSEISEMLCAFGLSDKIPVDMTTPISMTQNAPSGGEKGTFVLASQIWMALKTNTKIIFLDEPEKSFDEETSRACFQWIWDHFENTTFFVVVHNEGTKKFFKDNGWVTQEWKFDDPQKGKPRTFHVINY